MTPSTRSAILTNHKGGTMLDDNFDNPVAKYLRARAKQPIKKGSLDHGILKLKALTTSAMMRALTIEEMSVATRYQVERYCIGLALTKEKEHG
jgi:hypothetical protein